MRALIFSDTHRQTENMMMVIRRHGAGANAVIHLGDVLADVRGIKAEFPGLPLYNVPGNNDFGFSGKGELSFPLWGHTLFLTHGHQYGVKTSTDGIRRAGMAKGADIILYGHTHTALYEKKEHVHVFNPGSISRPYEGYPTYGILDITSDGEVVLTIVPVL